MRKANNSQVKCSWTRPVQRWQDRVMTSLLPICTIIRSVATWCFLLLHFQCVFHPCESLQQRGRWDTSSLSGSYIARNALLSRIRPQQTHGRCWLQWELKCSQVIVCFNRCVKSARFASVICSMLTSVRWQGGLYKVVFLWTNLDPCVVVSLMQHRIRDEIRTS